MVHCGLVAFRLDELLPLFGELHVDDFLPDFVADILNVNEGRALTCSQSSPPHLDLDELLRDLLLDQVVRAMRIILRSATQLAVLTVNFENGRFLLAVRNLLVFELEQHAFERDIVFAVVDKLDCLNRVRSLLVEETPRQRCKQFALGENLRFLSLIRPWPKVELEFLLEIVVVRDLNFVAVILMTIHDQDQFFELVKQVLLTALFLHLLASESAFLLGVAQSRLPDD